MKRFLALFRQTFKEFGEDKVPRLGAALAYYTIFSLAPLLLIVIGVAGVIFGKDAASHQLFDSLRAVLGPASATVLQAMVTSAAKPRAGTVAAVVGFVTLLLGATGVFGQLKDSLNTIWDVTPKKRSGIWGMVRDRFLSLAMVLGVGFLLLVSLVVDALIAGVGHFASSRLPGGEALWQIIQLGFSLIIVTALLAMIFRYLPDLKIDWRDVMLGAAFTSVLFVVGKFVIGLYLGKGAVGSTFGAAGSLVVVLVWIYYSAQIVLFGAEFTQVYANSRESKKNRVVAASSARLRDHRPADAESAEGSPKPLIAYRTVRKKASAGSLIVTGGAGFAAGVATLLLALVTIVVKSVRKLYS